MIASVVAVLVFGPRPTDIVSMTKLSFLDIVPVLEGGTTTTALATARDIAAHCEALGFARC
jgi:hypothetical protein